MGLVRRLPALSLATSSADSTLLQRPGVESPELKSRREIGFAACNLAGLLLHATDLEPGPVAAQRAFAAAVLRSQALDAVAKQHAAFSESLRPGQGQEVTAFRRSAAALSLSMGCTMMNGLQALATSAPEHDTLLAELAAALDQSRAVEHIARLLLLLTAAPGRTGSVAPAEAEPGWADFEEAMLGWCVSLFCQAYRGLCVGIASETPAIPGDPAAPEACLAPASPPGCTVAAARPAAASDGRPVAACEEAPSFEASNAALRRVLTAPGARHAVMALGLTALRELEGVSSLLLRCGYAMVESPRAPGGGGVLGQRPPGPLGASGGPLVVLELFRGLINLIRYGRPWTTPSKLALISDGWRLAAAALRHEVLAEGGRRPALGEQLKMLTSVTSLEAFEGGWRFPTEPPPPGLAAALAGGALPCLERLLRRAGEDPQGLEAELVACEPVTTPWGAILPFLAYGDPLQAAAFLASATKLLRRTHARALLRSERHGDGAGLSVVKGLLLTVDYPHNPGSPAPAVRDRLALVLSLALPEWLPELSRLALQAAAQELEAWRQEQLPRHVRRKQQGGGPCAAGGVFSCLYAVLSSIGAVTAGLDALQPPPLPQPASGDAGSIAAAAAAAASSGGGGGGAAGSQAEGWRQAGLTEAGADVRRALSGSGSTPAGAAFSWTPEALRTVAAKLGEQADLAGMAAALEDVAGQLEAWGPGVERGVSVSEEVWRAVCGFAEPTCTGVVVAGRLVSPAEARRRLGLTSCSNPACVSL
ncbi:hypothetical protein HYH03_017132 [Edaphochlamys debaryana]|uniref:Uncharacterized protein n=1 Tax=Edaphochlamys debaryana TaxID=47281 RepID=A0A835XJ06_9CHLO|nr:hypothetical protein HYH03_017132 [Edaphochlamys debaryana]|eukprot:KAG2484042.1 hypothetical protein HYH03_017132 [Edaphochlamys debaryana]